MTAATVLLNARHIGVRELKEHLSQRLKGTRPLIVTEHGTPTRVILSYRDMLELIEVLDELQDRHTLEAVQEGRSAVKRRIRGIPVARLFSQIRHAR